MKVAIHQCNFIPNFPFFYKMAQADLFVILSECQFEKNNYQNRYFLNEKEKWVTRSVKSGVNTIINKQYADGKSLFQLNYEWIRIIKTTLNIDTQMVMDYPTELKGTDRLIDIVKRFGGDTYLTNPSAKDKYLDEDLMRTSGIDIEYVNVPKHLQIHTFEAFEKFGIDGCIKQLKKAREYAIA